MTAIAPEKPGWKDADPRRVARRAVDWAHGLPDQVREFVAELKNSQEPLLETGKRVRFRFAQSLPWALAFGFIAAGFPAGLYDAFWQIHWYVDLQPWLPVHFEIMNLKQWWDDLFPYRWWTLYRHLAFRDILEPSIAIIAVRTLLAPRKAWNQEVSRFKLVTAPFILILLAIALGVAGVWLIDFSLPYAWQHVFAWFGLPRYKVSAHFLGTLSVSGFVLAFLIEQVLHRYWAPVGAWYQGWLMDPSIDYRQASGRRPPFLVRKPLLPPVTRERYAYGWRHNLSVRLYLDRRWFVLAAVFLFRAAIVLFVVLVTLLGLTGHYWVGSLHHHVPYLFPAGS